MASNLSSHMAVFFIWGLILSHCVVEYAVVNVLMNYLTDTWKQPSIREAAMVVNLLDGVSAVLVVVVTHVSEACTGHFNMIILCTAAYVMGLMLLWASIRSLNEFPTVYVAVVLIALGKAGKEPTLRSFLEYQLSKKVKPSAETNNEEPENQDKSIETKEESKVNRWWGSAGFIGALIGVFLPAKTWVMTFKVSALLMGTMYLSFYSGLLSYYPEGKPTGSPLATVYKVYKAAILKLRLRYPDSVEGYYWKNENPTPNQVYKRKDGKLHLQPHVPSLFRFLDKAAIISQSDELSQQQEEKNGDLCSVKEVTEVKRLYPVLPLGLTFFAYCLVVASGNTFFVAQQNNLNSYDYKLSVSSLFLLKYIVRVMVTSLFWRLKLTQQRITTVRIGAGMFWAVVCCLTAWQMELHRLSLVNKGNTNSDNEDVFSHIVSAAPQFLLLGLMEGFAEDGLANFFYNQVPKSLRKLKQPFTTMVLGIGKFFSIPCVLIFHSWFNDSINTSHLDRYFLMLAILSFVFFWIYVYYSWRYNLLQDYRVNEELDIDEQALEEEAPDQAAQKNSMPVATDKKFKNYTAMYWH